MSLIVTAYNNVQSRLGLTYRHNLLYLYSRDFLQF